MNSIERCSHVRGCRLLNQKPLRYPPLPPNAELPLGALGLLPNAEYDFGRPRLCAGTDCCGAGGEDVGEVDVDDDENVEEREFNEDGLDLSWASLLPDWYLPLDDDWLLPCLPDDDDDDDPYCPLIVLGELDN
jgi:hypothetical protein